MQTLAAALVILLCMAPLPAASQLQPHHDVSSPEHPPVTRGADTIPGHKLHTHDSAPAGRAEEPLNAAGPQQEEAAMMSADDKAPVVDISELKVLSDVIESVAAKRIVYVGETHDQYSHHLLQLDLIRELHERNTTLAIGMEMFQRPFQTVLDEYVSGKIDEKQLLKRSEYFTRWVFDYELYKPILDYAKDKRIPVIALNVRKEIVQKVSKGGIESLSEEDRKEIPSDMDYSDKDYRARLEEFYKTHPSSSGGEFEFFYQSQILWDEAMARSVDEFFRGNPLFLDDGQMVVLAGSGHLMYGSGIPKRVHRRNGLDYAIVLNQVPVSKGVADFVVYPKPAKAPLSPKLMVILTLEGGMVAIGGFAEESVSAKAGLKKRDRIVSLDGEPINALADVRIHMLSKKKGDTVKVKVMRKGLLFGESEKTFDVTL